MENLFLPHFLDAAKRGLNSSRVLSSEGVGLFSATKFDPEKCKAELTFGESQENSDNYSLAWVRDTLKCSAYDFLSGNYDQSRLTIEVLLKYFNKSIEIIDLTLSDWGDKKQLRHDIHVIMPRMHPLTLEPVHADQGKDLQLDMAELLKCMGLLLRMGAWQPSNLEDLDLITKILNYFIAWDYSLNAEIPGDFGIWEEGKGGTSGPVVPDVHTSTIGAMVAGFVAINGCRLSTVHHSETICINSSEIDRGIKIVNERLTTIGESESRKYDLATLIILYDHLFLNHQIGKGFLTNESSQAILSSIEKLERERGFVRYASDENLNSLDDYYRSGSPLKKSAEWTMGFGYAALIYLHLGWADKACEYLEKMESTFDWQTGLGLPEAYYGGTSEVVPVSPLSWSNSLYLMAYETAKQMNLVSV